MPELTIGRIVHYVLSPQDAEAINRRRVQGAGHGEGWPNGAQAHVGNQANAGDVVPALVVWPHQNDRQTFNGQAFLDGNDTYWLTSVPYSATYESGSWTWPPMVGQLRRT